MVLDFNSTSFVSSVPKPSSWRGDRKQTSSGIKVIHRRISREVLFNTCFTNIFCRHYNFEPHNTFITRRQQLYAWRKSPLKINKHFIYLTYSDQFMKKMKSIESFRFITLHFLTDLFSSLFILIRV